MTWHNLVTPRGRDVIFDAIVHVVWADGRLTPLEVGAVGAAADMLGLAARDLGATMLARRNRPFESLELGSLGPLERAFAYGAAVWVSIADGRVATSEYHTLLRIGRTLGLRGELAHRIEAWAWSVGDVGLLNEPTIALDRLFGKITAALLGNDAVSVGGWPADRPTAHARRLRRG